MTPLAQSIAIFLTEEFHNELALVISLSLPGKIIYGFYALAAVLVIRPHIRQAMKYRHGKAGKGDFCHRAQYEAIFWRLAPLLYAFVINSKLLGISVFIDLVGRLWTIHESHRAEKRFLRLSRETSLPPQSLTEGSEFVECDPYPLPAATPKDVETTEALTCPFCGTHQAIAMEVDVGQWAVWCSWCNAFGPHSRNRQLAIARWNTVGLESRGKDQAGWGPSIILNGATAPFSFTNHHLPVAASTTRKSEPSGHGPACRDYRGKYSVPDVRHAQRTSDATPPRKPSPLVTSDVLSAVGACCLPTPHEETQQELVIQPCCMV